MEVAPPGAHSTRGTHRGARPGHYVAPMPKKLAVLLMLLPLLAAGACADAADDGGSVASDDSADSANENNLTKAEFLAEGDQICGTLAAADSTVDPPDSPEGMPDYLAELISHAQEAQRAFEKLSPPSDGEDVKAHIVGALGTRIEVLEGASTAYENGDGVTGGDLITQADQEWHSADDEAQAYGFSECGKTGDAGGDEEEPSDPALIEEPA